MPTTPVETKPASAPAKKAAAKPKAAPRPKLAAKPAVKTVAKKAVKPAAKPAVKSPLKPAAKSTVKPATKTAAPKEKIKKPKLVRDSFTMPEAEYEVLGQVKKACIKAGFEVKKSELLRIGVALINKMDASQLKTILATLPPLKAGRPKKNK